MSKAARGLMYYWEAIVLQSFLDMVKDEEISKATWYKGLFRMSIKITSYQYGHNFKQWNTLNSHILYHVNCMVHIGDLLMIKWKTSWALCWNTHLHILLMLMKKNIERKISPPRFYYSVLVKVVDQLDQKIYRIKLLRHAIFGEGKLENQNSAIICTHN